MKSLVKSLLTTCLSCLLLHYAGKSETLIVPDQYPTIQAAIEASSNGDSIFIRPGVYIENLSISGKGVYLSSMNEIGPEDLLYETVVDGGHQGYVLDLQNCTDTVIIQGLTFCNGYGEHAGAILCSETLLRMENMLLRDNETWMSEAHGGGGMSIANGSVVFMKNVTITGNKAYNFGGGIKMRYDAVLYGENVTITGNYCGGGGHSKGGGLSVDYGCKAYLYKSVISNNSAYYWGGGVACGGNTSAFVSLVNCTLTGNTAGYGGGAIYACYEGNNVFLGNCILTGNLGIGDFPADQEIWYDDTGNMNGLAYICCDIKGGRQGMYIPSHSSAIDLGGNIDLQPYFKPALKLTLYSPCVDAGTDYCQYWGETLINIPENQYHGSAPDMGAFENFNVLVSVPEPFQAEEEWLRIYPNPSGDQVIIEIQSRKNQNCNILLMDGSGRFIMEKAIQPGSQPIRTTNLDLSGLSSGQYYIRAHSEGRTSVRKIIIQ